MKKKLLWVAFLVLCNTLVFSSIALAEDVVYKKHTVVDFGDDTIDGNLSKPDTAYIQSQKEKRHKRLIKPRSHFRTEILQSLWVL